MSQQPQVSQLKQQLFQVSYQLQLMKIQNQNLMTQLAQQKQKQAKLKQINDMLAYNLNKSEQQINDQITLKIDGEFLTKRIQQLQEESQKYRNGASDSVDRRVKKIVSQFKQQKQLQNYKRKSRLSLGSNNQNSKKTINQENHQHNKFYNIQYRNYACQNPHSNDNQQQPSTTEVFKLNRNLPNPNYSQYYPNQQNVTGQGEQSLFTPCEINIHNENQCQRCAQLQQMLREKDFIIERMQNRLENLSKPISNHNKTQSTNSQGQQWMFKYNQLFKLYENLRQQHDMAQDQYNRFSSNDQSVQNYQVTQSPINGFKKKQLFQNSLSKNLNQAQSRYINKQGKDREVMQQQITNLVNGLGGNRKNQTDYTQKENLTYDKNSRLSYANKNDSRISQQNARLDGSVFTIKEGVNRFGNRNNMF